MASKIQLLWRTNHAEWRTQTYHRKQSNFKNMKEDEIKVISNILKEIKVLIKEMAQHLLDLTGPFQVTRKPTLEEKVTEQLKRKQDDDFRNSYTQKYENSVTFYF